MQVHRGTGYTESPLKYRGQATTLQQSGKQVDLGGVQDPQRELQTARLKHGLKRWALSANEDRVSRLLNSHQIWKTVFSE